MRSSKNTRNTIIEEPQISGIRFTKKTIVISYDDGRVLSAPLWWYPLLNDATDAQRQNYELFASGTGVEWPDLDEVFSAKGFLKGLCQPSR